MPAFVSDLGRSDSTSYISVAQADDWYAGTLNAGDWTALTVPEKEAALMAATRALETLTYIGIRCSPSVDDAALEQALQWPRSDATCKGVAAACTMLPAELIGATASLALSLFKSPPSTETPVAGPIGAVQSQQLGDLSISYYDVRGGVSAKVNATAPLILQQYPYLVDMLGCWSDTATGASRIAPRVRS